MSRGSDQSGTAMLLLLLLPTAGCTWQHMAAMTPSAIPLLRFGARACGEVEICPTDAISEVWS